MSRSFLSKCRACVTDTSVKCLIGFGLGVGLGSILTLSPLSGLAKVVVCSSGEILSQLIENFSVPYTVTHLILGVTRVEPNISRKIFVRAVVYFISTTVLAITVGLTLSVLIKPGISGNINEADDDESFSSMFAIMDLIRNMVPDGLALATFQQHKTRLNKIVFDAEDQTSATDSTGLSVVSGHVNEVNILGLVIWSIVIGLCVRRSGEEARPLLDMCITINTAMDRSILGLSRIFPLGLLFMTARYIDEVGFSWETLIQFGKFTGVVVLGLAIHVIVLVLIYLLFVRRNPFTFIWGVCPALLTAMRSSQHSANQRALQCCEEVNPIDRRITRFMLALGCNINQDGTALYEVVVVMFIAQLSQISLNWSQLLVLSVTIAVSSLAEAGLPSPEPITTIFILRILEIPLRDTCFLWVIHWALVHFNSPVDVLGDCIGAAVVEQLSRNELEEMDEQGRNMPRESSWESESTTARV